MFIEYIVGALGEGGVWGIEVVYVRPVQHLVVVEIDVGVCCQCMSCVCVCCCVVCGCVFSDGVIIGDIYSRFCLLIIILK